MEKMRLLFIVLLTSFFCHTKAETSVWDGSSYSFDWYTTGSGAIYHIKTAADLAGLSRCFSTGYYLYGKFEGRTIILDNDIDLAGHEWTPIGFVDASNTYFEFAGVFDGNNHTIKGMSITKHNNKNIHVGLFGCNYSNSFQVKNLRVEGDINLNNINGIYDGGSIYAGGIVGYTWAGAIENCQSNVNISVTLDNGQFRKAICGGIVGHIEQSNIVDLCKNCFSKGNINVTLNNSNEASVGGLIGQSTCQNAIISSCASQSNIKVANGRMSYAGGIAGQADFTRMENALFTGSINLEYPNYGYAGGMMGGDRTTPSYFKCCLVTGTITKTYGTAWYSPFVGSAFEGSTGDNCYFLSGIPNSRNFGIEMSESELKSGNPLSGFDTSIWDFTEGSYPTLQFLKAVYTISVPTDNGRIGFCVKDGGSATIQLDTDDNWKLKAFYIDGIDYTEDVSNGRYTFSSVISNHVISAIFEKDASGIRMVERATSPQIKIAGRGAIEVENITGRTGIKVYDMNGKLVLTKSVSTNTKLNLNTGMYIIKIGEQTFKVSL